VDDEGVERSSDLDRVRKLLFGDVPEDEGWERIAAAIHGAADPERQEAIEKIASGDLGRDLMDVLRRLRNRDEADDENDEEKETD
jgi:hypothetical protein